MKWIKQSFIFAFRQPRESLILAIIGLATLYLSSWIPLAGIAICSIVFIFTLVFLTNHMNSLPLFKVKNPSSLLLTAVLLIPTNIMMGSVIGLLQGADQLLLTLAIVTVFSVFCALSYLTLAHTVGFIVLEGMHLQKAMDAALKGFAQHRLHLLMVSCLSAIILIAAAVPRGWGFIIAIPIHFYLYYFSFRDLYQLKKNEIDA